MEKESSSYICEKIETHVNNCSQCKRRLAFDPVEKAILKSVSIKNDVIELTVYIFNGIFILFFLQFIMQTPKSF